MSKEKVYYLYDASMLKNRANLTLKVVRPYFYEQCYKYSAEELLKRFDVDVSHMHLGDFEVIGDYAIWFCGYTPPI
jgi:hypothetical protein